MCEILSAEELCKSYSDKTGKFPITPSSGHTYIFVFYHYDTNTINGIAIKSRNTTEICDAWQTVYDQLKAHSEAPNIYKDMKTIFKETQVEYQLVPPHIHKRNVAERAIHIYKNHIITGLYTCDPKFRSREWDRILPQFNMTINLLRSSNTIRLFHSMQHYWENKILLQHQWHHMELRWLCMKKRTKCCHGQDMELRRGTLVRRLNTTDASNVTCQ